MAEGRTLAPCGTAAASKRHYKLGEELCEPCAEASRADSNRRYHPKRTTPPRDQPNGLACEVCQAPLLGRQAKYCGRKCSIRAAYSARDRDEHLDRQRRWRASGGGKSPRTCIVCGTEWMTANRDGKYCSDECKAVAYRGPNPEKPRPRPRTWNRRLLWPVPRRSEVAAYRVQLRTEPCWLCGARSDSLDHVIPRSANGPDDWDNLAPCCRRCNSAKQTLTLLEALLWVPESRDYHDRRKSYEEAKARFFRASA